jgi:prepilin-type N-terminal cleavage/methylation domain-containing protein
MKTRGFTLLELLIVISIISVLAALIMAAVGSVRRSGALAKEISGGRQMAAAYLRASNDRDGTFLVGYSATESATDDRGEEVINPACGRYPWRLAPYLEYRLKGIMLVNEQEKIADIKDHGDFVYRASAHPSFGINATYVGGNERTGLMPTSATLKRFGQFVATRLSQVTEPGKLIVFASSRFSGDGSHSEPEKGFHLLEPPRTTKVEWKGKFDEKMPAEKFGFVDLRHNKRAACVMLGGNVELLDETQIQDMRHWSLQAAAADDPEYLLKPIK